jgi:hypothetical protein
MNKGGIFQGLGNVFAGEKLYLRTPGQSNPLALATQKVLRDQIGFPNLAVDGKWGDCSEKALQQGTMGHTDPGSLVDFMGLDKLGISPSQVVTWQKKSPVCGAPAVQDFSAIKETKGWPEPALVAANALGVPVPAGICPDGRVPNIAASTCECPPGSYQNVNTGACEQFEQPQTMPPVIDGLLSKLRLTPTVPTFKRVSADRIWDKRFTVVPKTDTGPSSMISKLSVVKAPVFSLVPSGPGPRSFKFVDGFMPATGSAGMGTGTKLALGALALAAIGGIGVVLWRRSQASSAVPNCYWANDFRANCYSSNCYE